MESEIKIGLKVKDIHISSRGIGEITEVLKTSIKVLFHRAKCRWNGRFEELIITYSMSNTVFLEVVK